MKYTVKKINDIYYLRAKIKLSNQKYKDIYQKMESDNYESLSDKEKERTIKKASRLLDEKVLKFNKQEYIDITKKQQAKRANNEITLENILDDFLKYKFKKVQQKELKESYYDVLYRKASVWKRFSLFQIKANDLSPADIEQYIIDRIKGDYIYIEETPSNIRPVGASTIQHEARFLSQMFNRAHRLKVLPYVDFDDEGECGFDFIVKKLMSKKRIEKLILELRGEVPFSSPNERTTNEALTKEEFIALRNEVFRPNTYLTYSDIYFQCLDEAINNNEISEDDGYIIRKNRFESNKDESFAYLLQKDKKRQQSKPSYDIENGLYMQALLIENRAINIVENEKMPGTECYYPLIRKYKINNTLVVENKLNCEYVNNHPIINGKEQLQAHTYAIHRTSHTDKETLYYNSSHGSINNLVILFLMNTGYRIEEAINIKLKDVYYENNLNHWFCRVQTVEKSVIDRDKDGEPMIDKNGNYIYKDIIDDLKTRNSNREVPLNDGAMLAINTVLELSGRNINDIEHQDEYIFLHVTCQYANRIKGKSFEGKDFARVNINNIRKTLKAMAKNAHISNPNKVTPHALRHTIASLSINSESTNAIKPTQKLLGHSKADITMNVYADAFTNGVISLVDNINNI